MARRSASFATSTRTDANAEVLPKLAIHAPAPKAGIASLNPRALRALAQRVE
jgi:hypothetical protein